MNIYKNCDQCIPCQENWTTSPPVSPYPLAPYALNQRVAVSPGWSGCHQGSWTVCGCRSEDPTWHTKHPTPHLKSTIEKMFKYYLMIKYYFIVYLF